MWRVWNKLFGWDYVGFNYGHRFKIRRLRFTADGVPFALAYGDYIPMTGRTIVPLTQGAIPWVERPQDNN